MIYVWLAILAVTLIIEFLTYDMVCIWFSAGAFVSMIVSIFWDDVLAQIIIFIAVSVITMIFFRNKALKFLNKNKYSTNVDAFIGKQVTLIKTAEGVSYGEVKMENGIIWNVATRGERIESGSKVEIIAVEGNKLIVQKLKEE